MGGVSKTRLMYKAYIPHKKLTELLNLLLLSGHLEHDNLDFVFRTTNKGFNFLNTFKQIHRLSLQDKYF